MLERSLSLRLVERSPSGYSLTEGGVAVLPCALQVAAAIEAFRSKAIEAAHADILLVTCPEPIAVRLTQSGFIERFHAQYPDLQVQFVLADRYIDLSKSEADVALRSGDTEGDLVGRKIADSIWAAYASRAYLAGNSAPSSVEDLKRHPLIALDESLSRHRLSQWLREAVPEARFSARSSSVLGLVSAAKAGLGVAVLPIALGDAEGDLVRVLEPIPELTRAWRVLAHPQGRHLRRVDAFFEFVVSNLAALKPILTG